MTTPISPPPRPSSYAWLTILFLACVGLIWTDYTRIQRASYVSNLDREDAVVDAHSPTGYAGGKRWLIVPEQNLRSYQWISQTQQMLASGTARVRRVVEENAPFGRPVYTASPYRWWLGLIAGADHLISGQPLGISVERAALVADPLLHLLLLIGTTCWVARHFGSRSAVLVSFAWITLFPLSGGFLPGACDDTSLALACAVGSLLPLLASYRGTVAPAGEGAPLAAKQNRSGFFLSGVFGGLGLWISVAREVPFLLGISAGALVAAWLGSPPLRRARNAPSHRTRADDEIPAWRQWALGGAATSLVAYLVEYFPDDLGGLRLQVNHPLYGIAWLGVGEVLFRIQSWVESGKLFRSWRDGVGWALALLAIGAVPVALFWSKSPGFFVADPLASRLTFLPNGATAKNFSAWLNRDGLTIALAATLLPLGLLLPASWLVLARNSARAPGKAVALAAGPVVVSALLAFSQLQWWATVDAALIGLIVAVAAGFPAWGLSARAAEIWTILVGSIFIAGAVALTPFQFSHGEPELTRLEVESLFERALAHALADQAGPAGAVILAPPARTASLCFYGGVRGLGTPTWENQEGVAATVLVVTATTADEALALINQRGVTHLVLPSWDSDLDEFARLTLSRPEDSFIAALHRWALPPWLKPVPYHLPTVAGFEGESVVVLEVTEENERAPALSRLAEYFIEMQQLDLAAAAGETLQQFPADLGALIARAEIAKARSDSDAFGKLFGMLVANLSGGFDRALPWDRRVSLAVVLAQGNRADLSQKQLQRCWGEVDETRIRSLTTGALYRLQALAKAYGLKFGDPRLQDLARRLLPLELRSRLDEPR